MPVGRPRKPGPLTYSQIYYRQNAEKLKAQERQRYKELRSTAYGRRLLKARREKLHFGFPSSVVFRKTQGKCAHCGRNRAQIVHHEDHDGRNFERLGRQPGRDIKKLWGLCRACHMDEHRTAMMLVKKTRKNGYWSRIWDACVLCRRSDKKHDSKGLCITCYARETGRRRRGVPSFFDQKRS